MKRSSPSNTLMIQSQGLLPFDLVMSGLRHGSSMILVRRCWLRRSHTLIGIQNHPKQELLSELHFQISDSSTIMDLMAGFYPQALLPPSVSLLSPGGKLEKLQRPSLMRLMTSNLHETQISHVHMDVPSCLQPPFFPTHCLQTAPQLPISTQWKAEQCSVTLARTWTPHLFNTATLMLKYLSTIIWNHESDITNNIDSAHETEKRQREWRQCL